MILECFKDGELVESIQLSASKRLYTVGRQAGVSDVFLSHASISREQATMTVSASGTVVIMDVGSSQGTFISGKKLPPKKKHTLPPGRSLVFGKSTRIYKLREGASGFVNDVEAAPVPKPRRPYNETLATALLSVLRRGSLDDCERLRPDGYVPLAALLASSALASFRCTEAEARTLVADTEALELFELRTEGGALLMRAQSGHEARSPLRPEAPARPLPDPTLPSAQPCPRPRPAPSPPHGCCDCGLPASGGAQATARVDLTLDVRACGDEELAPHAPLVHGAAFKDWNAIRSQGIGGQSPCRFWTRPPRKGERMFGMARAADVLVYVRVGALLADGLRLFIEAEPEAEAEAAADPEAQDRQAVVCSGDPADGGVVGVWHFEKVVNARDGSELMGPDEIAPLRAARQKQLLQRAEAADAATAKVVAKKQRDDEKAAKAEAARLAEEKARQGPEPVRYNPYAAHLDEAERKRKREEEEEEDY